MKKVEIQRFRVDTQDRDSKWVHSQIICTVGKWLTDEEMEEVYKQRIDGTVAVRCTCDGAHELPVPDGASEYDVYKKWLPPHMVVMRV